MRDGLTCEIMSVLAFNYFKLNNFPRCWVGGQYRSVQQIFTRLSSDRQETNTRLDWTVFYLSLRIVAALLSCYLQEQWTLVLGLGVRSPEPVGQPSSLGGGHVVTQGQGLLLQLLSGVVPGQQALPLALPPQPQTDNIMNCGYTN